MCFGLRALNDAGELAARGHAAAAEREEAEYAEKVRMGRELGARTIEH